MANLQLFKVNGIPILNLKHLASVLDEITKPFSDGGGQSEQSLETTRLTAMEEELEDGTHEDGEPIGKDSAENPRQVEEILRLKEGGGETDCSDARCYAQLKTLEDVKKPCDRESSVCEATSNALAGYSNAPLKRGDFTCSKTNSAVSPSLLFSTQPSKGSGGVDEDPTLLNRKDYVHFELDKDKIIVLHILTAYKSAPDILQQYAIGQPRSDDLPPPP